MTSATKFIAGFVLERDDDLEVGDRPAPGIVDFGHEDLALMHTIHHTERKISSESDGSPAGIMGLLDVESFQNTKESFAFGKYAHLSEEVLDEELT